MATFTSRIRNKITHAIGVAERLEKAKEKTLPILERVLKDIELGRAALRELESVFAETEIEVARVIGDEKEEREIWQAHINELADLGILNQKLSIYFENAQMLAFLLRDCEVQIVKDALVLLEQENEES